MIKSNHQALLITGEMRSGTTFLANFLNTQTGAVVYADMLVSLFMEAHNMQINDINRSLSDREKNVLLSNIIQEGKLHHVDFSSIERALELSWLELFIAALDVLRGDSGGMVVGVKRTSEALYLEALLHAGVKVIYCVRDPRDVVISAQNRFGNFNLFNTVEKWKNSARRAWQLRDHPGFMLLRYEDLILRKEETADSLSKFLGVPVTTNFDKFSFGHDKEYQENSSFGDVERLFDPKAVNRWKKSPNETEIIFCEGLLASEMQLLNYELVPHDGYNRVALKRLKNDYKRYNQKKRIKRRFKTIFGRWIN